MDVNEEEENLLESKKQVPKRDSHGRLLPGYTANPIGRKPDQYKIDKETLIRAIQEVEKGKGKQFLHHIIERAYRSDTVLNKIIDKFFADVSITELKNTGNMPLVVHLTQFLESRRQEKEKNITPVDPVEDENQSK